VVLPVPGFRLARATLNPVTCAVSQRLTGFGSRAGNVGTRCTNENYGLTQRDVASGAVLTRIATGRCGARNWLAQDNAANRPASSFSMCSNAVTTALLQPAALRSSGPCSGTDHRRIAGHEAILPGTAVDTAIPMTRGGDKLRTVCGRPRRNTAA
jgi:hypothetical protein